MKYSQIKAIKSFCESLCSTPDYKEVLQNIIDGSEDFEVDNVRFINSDNIDQILADELSNDEYILGCFNVGFIADCIGIDSDAIEALQKAEAYEAIGKLIKSLGKVETIATEYARADGYGHHFNSYDSGEEELRVNAELFHVFDNR